jgi:hypothetical protein
MTLDECSPIPVFLQSENEARLLRDKPKFDCFKPAFIKTPIEEIHIDDSEDDGNTDPRSAAGYVKRREGSRRAIDPPSRSNKKRGNYTDREAEKEADGLEANSGSGNGGEDGGGGSGGGGRDEKKEDEEKREERKDLAGAIGVAFGNNIQIEDAARLGRCLGLAVGALVEHKRADI